MSDFTTRPEIRGTFGVVTSTHWIASAVGMSILEKGGNAFDAAVATALTLQVVEPHLNGPAGDMPAIFYSVDTGIAGIFFNRRRVWSSRRAFHVRCVVDDRHWFISQRHPNITLQVHESGERVASSNVHVRLRRA